MIYDSICETLSLILCRIPILITLVIYTWYGIKTVKWTVNSPFHEFRELFQTWALRPMDSKSWLYEADLRIYARGYELWNSYHGKKFKASWAGPVANRVFSLHQPESMVVLFCWVCHYGYGPYNGLGMGLRLKSLGFRIRPFLQRSNGPNPLAIQNTARVYDPKKQQSYWGFDIITSMDLNYFERKRESNNWKSLERGSFSTKSLEQSLWV